MARADHVAVPYSVEGDFGRTIWKCRLCPRRLMPVARRPKGNETLRFTFSHYPEKRT